MTFTGDESFAEPLRFPNELRVRRAGDRLGQALSSTPVIGHSLGILTAPPPPTPRKMRAPDREKSDLTPSFRKTRGCRLARFVFTTCERRNSALGCANLRMCLGYMYTHPRHLRLRVVKGPVSGLSKLSARPIIPAAGYQADQERQFFCRVSK